MEGRANILSSHVQQIAVMRDQLGSRPRPWPWGDRPRFRHLSQLGSCSDMLCYFAALTAVSQLLPEWVAGSNTRDTVRAPDVTVLVKRVRRMATHSLVVALDHATGYQGQGGRWRSSLHLPTTIPAPGPFLLRTARHFEPRASLADSLAQTYGALVDDGGPGWDAGISFDKRMRTGMRASRARASVGQETTLRCVC
ncbi:hypothetical protein PCL_01429 [Purpureocillium lilacinum]|uniref:Uncharacterized protein n=1 Tax=Purpureocillium lilacinum TaxID=33203 RepID=A0A2U3E3J3_PURLI|nr:hypothetical protein PCL_01429 [Purpureocillium lilacinum]